MAVDMVAEGLIDEREAVRRVDPMALDQLLHPTLDPKAERNVLTTGLPASPGAAAGKIVLDADTAEQWAGRGEKVILVRVETSPEDIHGMHAAQGILTARGGMTSHAAVVARGMGRPCVSGAGAVSIDRATRKLRIGTTELKEGDAITLDGATGQVMLGIVPTVEPELAGDFGTLMVWADKLRRMKVRTNAETPEDCRMARQAAGREHLQQPRAQQRTAAHAPEDHPECDGAAAQPLGDNGGELLNGARKGHEHEHPHQQATRRAIGDRKVQRRAQP
jgi:pyruvate,orthophosphate dikinase